MKMAFMIVAMLLSLVCIMPAQTNRVDEAIAKPLPTMDFVLQQMVARAVGKEDQNDDCKVCASGRWSGCRNTAMLGCRFSRACFV